MHRIKYLCVHGFLALDGAEYVVRRMQELAADTHSFILDLHQAIGISESAARLVQQARVGFAEEGIALVCSRIQDRREVLDPLAKAVLKGDRGFLVFEDNDLAVEWCENRLVRELGDQAPVARTLADSLLFRGTSAALLEAVEATATTRRYAAGERILAYGEACDGSVYFVESGHVSVLLPLESGAHQRIASLGPGMEFGEMALLGGPARSASVVADTDVCCRVLDAGALARIAEAAPQLRIAMLENLAAELAGRLRGANQWIAALA